jgi:hypothetical protein
VKGAFSKQEIILNNDLNRTLDNIKNTDEMDLDNKAGGKYTGKGGSLHETDLLKIAVRNMSEQDILANFASIQSQ